MTCTNCGKSLPEKSSVTEDGFLFCNNICRYEWKRNGKPTPFEKTPGQQSAAKVAVNELDFPVDPPGFENRQMRVRLSYWTSPKVFLDGTQLQPLNSGFFSKTREYSAMSNFGRQVAIRLRRKPLDLIPGLEIDGKEFPIARPLNAWEYIWISIPMILMFIGGGIGAFIGAIATFSNSLVMRRI